MKSHEVCATPLGWDHYDEQGKFLFHVPYPLDPSTPVADEPTVHPPEMSEVEKAANVVYDAFAGHPVRNWEGATVPDAIAGALDQLCQAVAATRVGSSEDAELTVEVAVAKPKQRTPKK